MNLLQTLDCYGPILAGGPGSGRHPYGSGLISRDGWVTNKKKYIQNENMQSHHTTAVAHHLGTSEMESLANGHVRVRLSGGGAQIELADAGRSAATHAIDHLALPPDNPVVIDYWSRGGHESYFGPLGGASNWVRNVGSASLGRAA